MRSRLKLGNSPWLKGIREISLPIAHGEGKYLISPKDYKMLMKEKRVAFKYEKGEICQFQNLEANPNGSNYDIAGILGYNGRVLGMMPHPERAIFFHHSPLWQSKKIKGNFKKNGLPALLKFREQVGDGILLFKNAVNYFKKLG